MHDQTAVKTKGPGDLLDQYPTVQFLADSGYRGLASDHSDQVTAPPPKPKKDATPEQVASWEAARKPSPRNASQAEHAIALIKWR